MTGRHVFRTLVALSFVGARHALDLQAQSPPRLPLDSARRALAEYARRADAQGVSGVLLVATGDTVLLHAGIGWRDRARTIPNDTTTLFYIASIVKQFVAAAVLALEEDHRLRTSDSLGRYLADVPIDKRGITLDQLLSHTSGLGRYGFDIARRDWVVEDRDQAVRGILATELAHKPGSQFDYQNTNFLLLGAIIERTAGVPLETYIESRLLRRAGLHDTYVGSRVTDALRARVAWSLGDESESFTIMDRPPSWLSLGRGVVMTAGDLWRWVRAVDRDVVLSAASRSKLFTIRASLGPGYGYGAGWFVRTDSMGAPRVVFHRGDFGSYHSEVRLYPPSGRVFVAMTNVGFRGASLTETLLNQTIDVTRGAPDPLPSVVPIGRDLAASLAGEYRAPSGEYVIVNARGASLVITPVGQRAADWLLRGDTAGWRDRQLAGERTLALVDALNHGHLDSIRGIAELPADVRRDLASEWAGLTRVGGTLKSFQLLGGVGAERNEQVGIVRLKLQRDSLLFGVGWVGDTLRYTSAGIRNHLAPMVFVASSATEWVAYDWSSETLRRMTVSTAERNERPTLTLHTPAGPVVFVRR